MGVPEGKIQYVSIYCQVLKHCMHVLKEYSTLLCGSLCAYVQICSVREILNDERHSKCVYSLFTLIFCVWFSLYVHVIVNICVRVNVGAYMPLYPCSMCSVSRLMPLCAITVRHNN